MVEGQGLVWLGGLDNKIGEVEKGWRWLQRRVAAARQAPGQHSSGNESSETQYIALFELLDSFTCFDCVGHIICFQTLWE